MGEQHISKKKQGKQQKLKKIVKSINTYNKIVDEQREYKDIEVDREVIKYFINHLK